MKSKTIILLTFLLICAGCNGEVASSTSKHSSSISNKTTSSDITSPTSSIINNSSNNGQSNVHYWDVNFYYNYEGNDEIFITKQAEHNKNMKKIEETPVRPGYEFTNWYKDTYCMEQWVFIIDKVTAPTNLYAGWKKVEEPEPTTYTINWANSEGVCYNGVNGNLPTKVEENEEVSFYISIDDGYTGTPIVKVNNEVLEAVDDIYTFVVTSDVTISVEGIERLKVEEPTTYRITFTLPNFDPAAVNPRLYYWGSQPISDSIFNLGANSNMSRLENSTYYIDFDLSVKLDGIIIIFDQGNEVKQSFDITNNLPTSAGTYHINVPDWGPDGWKQNSYGVWCFVAEIVKQ